MQLRRSTAQPETTMLARNGRSPIVTIQVLADRECGSCNICCVALTIDDPELQKPQGYRCRNTQRDGSCVIYPTRPQTCRAFNCGWRVLRFVRQNLRPDRSGVLIRLHNEVSSKTGATTTGIIVGLLTTASLKAEGLAETIAAAVAGNFPVYITVPGPPGYTNSVARINDAVADARCIQGQAPPARNPSPGVSQGPKRRLLPYSAQATCDNRAVGRASGRHIPGSPLLSACRSAERSPILRRCD